MTDQAAYQLLNQVVAKMTAGGEVFEIGEARVRGHSMRVWKNAPLTMRDFWLGSRQFGPRDYLVYQQERLTYEQTHQAVERIVNALVSRGIKQHDRVAIAMRNYPEWLQAYWAIICLGAVPVGVNAWWVPEELEYGLRDSGARLLICDQERLQRFASVRQHFPQMQVVSVRVTADHQPDWALDWSTLLDAPTGMPEVVIDPEDDACIFYTSGTTGHPKGAQLSHRGCANNAMTMVFFSLAQAVAQALVRGEAPPNPSDPNAPQSATIVATPLFHVTANNCLAHGMTATGGKIVHMYKWDAGVALKLIEQEGITGFSGVPTMAREIISHPDFANTDTSKLQTLAGGGAAVQADLVDRIVRDGDGTMPSQGYGMTELCGIAVAGAGIFLAGKPDSTGFVSPVLDLKIVNTEGQEVAVGARGEVCLYGPQVITGYLNRPDATAATIVDGWLHTGDVGFVDNEGFLYLVDRIKEMVLRGGENVYCLEVETALYKSDGVAECSVFGVPDERLGEEVGAAIFAREGVKLDAQRLREACAQHLAAYKIPKYIWLVDDPLPRNANGKFVKKVLRDSLKIADAQ